MPTKEQSFGHLNFKWDPDFKWSDLSEPTQHLFTPYQLGRKLGSWTDDLVSKTLPYLGGAALGGSLGYTFSGKKNKTRNTILGILGGLGAATGFDFLTRQKPIPVTPEAVKEDVQEVAKKNPEAAQELAKKLIPDNLPKTENPEISANSNQIPAISPDFNTILNNYKRNPLNPDAVRDLSNLLDQVKENPKLLSELSNEISDRDLISTLPRTLNDSPAPVFNLLNQKNLISDQMSKKNPAAYGNAAAFFSSEDPAPTVGNAITAGSAMLPASIWAAPIAASLAQNRNVNLGENNNPATWALGAGALTGLTPWGSRQIKDLALNIGRSSTYNPLNLIKSFNRAGPAMVAFNAFNDLIEPVTAGIKANDTNVFRESLFNQNKSLRGELYDKLNLSDSPNPFVYNELTPLDYAKLFWNNFSSTLLHPVSHPAQVAKGIDESAANVILPQPDGTAYSHPFAVRSMQYLQQQKPEIQNVLKQISPQDLNKLNEITSGTWRLLGGARDFKENDFGPKIQTARQGLMDQGLDDPSVHRILGTYLGGLNIDDPFQHQRTAAY